MWMLLKLILATTIRFSFALSSNIKVHHTKVTWTEAVVRCNITGSRIATTTDLDQDEQLCKNEILENTSFWIGNYYRLSNIIEVEGCYLSDVKDSFLKNGHRSLHDCYQTCSMRSNTLIFAHKNFMSDVNCICNITSDNIPKLGERNQLLQCLNSNRSLWWKYKINKNGFQTGNESCQQISCTNNNFTDTFVKDTLCGPPERGKIPDMKLLHFCSTNQNNNTTKYIELPWKFSFISNAPVETDSNQIQPKVAKCKAIACVKGNRYETLTMKCSSENLGFICSNVGTSLHFNNTPSTTSASPINITIYSSEQHAKKSFHTNARKITTESSTSKEKKTSVSSELKLEHDVFTSANTKYQEKITTFATIPGAPNIKSSKTYISSDSHSHVTKSSKENIVHSTSHEVLNQITNDNSPIGLLVGLIVTSLGIVAVVVLLVVCRFKRKGPFKNKKYGDGSQKTKFDSTNLNEKDMTSDTKTQTVENSTYDMHTAREIENKFSLSDPDSNHLNNTSNSEYAIVIKNKQVTGNTTDHQQSNDAEDLGEIENEYDRFNHNRPDSFTDRNNTTNIYDTALGFRDISDSTYVTANHVHVVDKDENNVYDHM